jgi:hypothetical protein
MKNTLSDYIGWLIVLPIADTYNSLFGPHSKTSYSNQQGYFFISRAMLVKQVHEPPTN